MSALAIILKKMNYNVYGWDKAEDFFTSTNLSKNNIKIDKNIKYNTFYIYIIGNSYINDEKVYEIKNNYLYYDYSTFLDLFFKNYNKICITGTHGKTTTTKLVKELLNSTSLIGDGEGFYNKKSNYFVFEGCEYKDNFLKYNPDILIINNIDLDHVDYFKDINQVINSFQKLVNKSKYKIAYYTSNTIKLNNLDYIYKVNEINEDDKYFYLEMNYKNNKEIIKINKINYMINNISSMYYLAKILNIKTNKIKKVIKKFKMPLRRLNRIKDKYNIIIDDYAHHPKEIKEAILSLKNIYKNKKINVIFQPHTYSRYEYFYKEIINSLELADKFYILEPFSSNREKKKNIIIKDEYKLDINYLRSLKNEVIVFMGAGDVFKYYKKVFNY